VMIRPVSPAEREVALGYEFISTRQFTRVRFQEGVVVEDGGFFEEFRVDVRHQGTWAPVTNLRVTPSYPGYNADAWESFSLDFDPAVGDAIRLAGVPGGAARLVSIAELQVWARDERTAP
jgi:hypothetical protein